MNNDIVKIAFLIDELESNGFYKEANILHEEFIKLAEIPSGFGVESGQVATSLEQTSKPSPLSLPAAKSIGLARSLFKKTPKPPKFSPRRFRIKLKSFGKGNLIAGLVNMGIDQAQAAFENAQGPFVLFPKYMPDIERIISRINSLIGDSQTKSLSSGLLQELKNCNNQLKEAEKAVKTEYEEFKKTPLEEDEEVNTVTSSNNTRTKYNNQDNLQKLAIRGEFGTELPKIFQDAATGAAVGGALGLVSGPGAGIAALIGGATSALPAIAEWVWYNQVSDTGKAYYQAKDLDDIISRLADSLETISPDLSFSIRDKADRLMSRVEEVNKKNPNKTYLENVIRHFEKKVEKVVAPVAETAKKIPGVTQEAVEKGRQLGRPRTYFDSGMSSTIDGAPSRNVEFFGTPK